MNDELNPAKGILTGVVLGLLFWGLVAIIIVSLSGCASIDSHFDQYGQSYDCGRLYKIPSRDIKNALEWCMVDPSKDFSKNEYGETKDWKTGEWKR